MGTTFEKQLRESSIRWGKAWAGMFSVAIMVARGYDDMDEGETKKRGTVVDTRFGEDVFLESPLTGSAIGSVVHQKEGFTDPHYSFQWHAVFDGKVVQSCESRLDAVRSVYEAWVDKRMKEYGHG